MTPKQKTNLQRLLRPRHIAFVGGDDAASAADATGSVVGVELGGELPPYSSRRSLDESLEEETVRGKRTSE